MQCPPDDSKATTGLVLNLPSTSLLQDAVARGWEPGEFNGERIYYGGPVEMNSLHILHSHGELEKCTEVIDGVYVGGFEDAHAQVKSNTIPATEFKLLVGYSSATLASPMDVPDRSGCRLGAVSAETGTAGQVLVRRFCQ